MIADVFGPPWHGVMLVGVCEGLCSVLMCPRHGVRLVGDVRISVVS